ncbi:MAG: hypothetical protein C4K47_08530 [Candidatus Thorarchaeota archaeon]|nr:MAG: hypothetical protein C4K47_08530 [Candidatus Thorarchaeota archaeon]
MSTTPDRISYLRADSTGWLLEQDNASVRYFALRDLLECPPKDPEVLDAKLRIGASEQVTKIFLKQKPDGHWERPEEPYQPKYKASYWQVMLLGMLGLDKSDERVRSAINHIFSFQHEEGGFAQYGAEGARAEYDYVSHRASRYGKTILSFRPWAEKELHDSQMSCLTGNVSLALIRLGYSRDARLRKALNWLVKVQNLDGGWLCPYWGAHIHDKHGCFMGTITPLHAFAEYPKKYRTPGMQKAIETGVEFLLMHRLFKADNHGFKVIKPSWLTLSFPQFFYDILRALLVVTSLGYAADERIDDALKEILHRQNEKGRWAVEATLAGRLQTTLEKQGRPSKWITLDALRVIKNVVKERGQLNTGGGGSEP